MDERYMDEECRSVLYNGLPQNIRHEAKIQLHESEEGVKKGIERLRNIIRDNNYPPMDDTTLVQFLRVAKFDLKKAVVRLKRYHLMRCRMATFLHEHLDLDTIRAVLRSKMIAALPSRDSGGRAIICTQGVAWRPELWSFDCFLVTFFVLGHFLNSRPITSVMGFTYIPDFYTDRLQDYYVYLKTLKNHYALVNALPVRVHKVHGVHDSSLVRFLYNTARPILPSFLTKKVFLHGNDFEALHQNIRKEILPEEFGGTAGPLSNDFLEVEFLEYVSKFKVQNQLYISLNNNSKKD